MNTKHTPEPWGIFDESDYYPGIGSTETGRQIVFFGEEDAVTGVRGSSHEQALANAKRIIACVNACKNIDPDALSNAAEVVKEIIEAALEVKNASSCAEENGAVDKLFLITMENLTVLEGLFEP